MKELKFKVWDNQTKKMSPHPIRFGESVPVWNGAWGYHEPTIVNDNPERFTVLQYTGIEDNDGIEIYEGDHVIDGAEQKLTAGTVFFKDGSYKLKLIGIRANLRTGDRKEVGKDFGTYHLASRKWYGLYVVGNVYEMPNLIEELGLTN